MNVRRNRKLQERMEAIAKQSLQAETSKVYFTTYGMRAMKRARLIANVRLRCSVAVSPKRFGG